MRTIALLSDFGLTDSYVGVMKAVLCTRVPEVRLLDITHGVPPQQVVAGALALDQALPYLPTSTVVLAVVDPGVGTHRRGIAVVGPAGRGVGPDNGLLSPLLVPGASVHELSAPKLRLPRVSHTFHGRDIFAPAAAYLCNGGDPRAFGGAVVDPERIALRSQVWDDGELVGIVLATDRFGNLITNLTQDDLPALGTASLEGRLVGRIRRTYGDVAPGDAVALVGSSGRLEVSVNQGSAARTFDAGPGSEVRVRPATTG